MEKKADRRIQKTKRALHESRLELLKTQPVEQMSISQLCGMANVNRSSFYKYYSIPLDILREMEQELFQEFSMNRTGPPSGRPALHLISLLLRQIYERRSFCKLLFGPHGNTAVLDELLQKIHGQCIEEFGRRNPALGQRQREYLFAFWAQGSRGIIERWIGDDCPEPPEEITELIARMSLAGMRAYHLDPPGAG